MKAPMSSTHAAAAILAVLLVATTVTTVSAAAEETVTITESKTVLDRGYDGVAAYIGDLAEPRVQYSLRRPIIANRGLKLIGKNTPVTGHVFSCELLHPTFYTGTFSVSKFLPTNSYLNVDSMTATMQLSEVELIPVIYFKDMYLTNNISVVIIRGTVAYLGRARGAVVRVMSSNPFTMSKSTLSIVGLRVSGADSVLTIGDVYSSGAEYTTVTGDSILSVDSCTVSDMWTAVVDIQNSMALSDHSVFRVSGLTMSGPVPVVRYISGGEQRVTGGSLYVLQNINSPQANIFELESGAQSPFFTADSRSTVSFLDITAVGMGVTESVPRSPSGAQVYGQQCRFNNALLANTVDAYKAAHIAATKVLASLRDVDTQQCQAALCVPEYTTSVVQSNNACACACASNKQQDMCSANQNPARGFVLCNDPNCYLCTTPTECAECMPTHTHSPTDHTCFKSTCAVANCNVCPTASCQQCKEHYTLKDDTTCILCTVANCRHCKPLADNQCDACNVDYAVSNGACIPYTRCRAAFCDKCLDDDADKCERCAPTYFAGTDHLCGRCIMANCLACTDGGVTCTECASGFKVTGNGCEPDAAAGLLHTGWLVLTLAVAAHLVCFF